ncbi:MAG: hypothetical protein ACFCU2_13335 [Acidimicrobiia bacterium]
MDTAFDDWDAFSAFRDRLVGRFEKTAAGKGLGWVAATVADFKFNYLDADLGTWSSGQVGEILLRLFPAKVNLEPGDDDAVVEGFAAFLRFLGSEGVAEPSEAERSAAMVERFHGRFREATTDKANWSIGKRLMDWAAHEGYTQTDQDSLSRAMAAFNSLPFDERDAILGPGLPPLPRHLPPISLPPDEELAAAAASSVWVDRVRKLMGYIGEGRAVTARGNLKLVDGPPLIEALGTNDRFNEEIGGRVWKTQSTTHLREVNLTYALSVESGLLEVVGNKVVPGINAPHAAGSALELHEVLVDAWLDVMGPTQFWYGDDTYSWYWYTEELDRILPDLLAELLVDESVEIEYLAGRVWDHLLDVYDLDGVPERKLDFAFSLVGSSVRKILDWLADFGIVEVSDVATTEGPYGFDDHSGGTVVITPLGQWTALRRSGEESAPRAGRLRQLDASELLRQASDLMEGQAQAEIDVWVSDRSEEQAASGLAAALSEVDETARGLGFRALLRIGAAASEAVETLAHDERLAPYVTVWRVDTLAASPEEMDCSADPERFVRLLAAVIELWGPDAATFAWADRAAGGAGLEAMLDRAWRVRLDSSEDVLAALGSHPDKAVAKTARRALFRYRSSG